MQNGNTLYYHGHILSNIDKLDQRKNSYIGHRLDFLDQQCQPIKHRIAGLKEDIRYYENMRDTQNQVIQSQSQILVLKKSIKEYTNTKDYFEGKLDEYDRLTVQLEQKNKNIKNLLLEKREEYKLVNGGINGRTLSNSIVSHNRLRSLKRQKSILGSTIGGIEQQQPSYLYQNKNNQQQQEEELNVVDQKNIKLPQIAKTTNRKPLSKYYVFNQVKLRSQHQRLLLLNKSQKISKLLHSSSDYGSLLNNTQLNILEEQSQGRYDEKVRDLITLEEIKSCVSQFDKTESLFRQCFQRKKIGIQKSVSQLQSRLITNKDIFLTACQVIGEKNGDMPLEDFMELSGDQLITLFISFSWLNRRIYGEFVNKRKNILGLLKKSKNMDPSTVFKIE